MARSATCARSSATAFAFSSSICRRAVATSSSASLRARAVSSWRSTSTSCWFRRASSAASRCAWASELLLLGEQPLRLGALLLRGLDRLADRALPLGEHLHDRAPGELRQDERAARGT